MAVEVGRQVAFAFNLRPSRLAEWRPEAAAQLVRSILSHSHQGAVAFDLAANHKNIWYRLVGYGAQPISIDNLQSLVDMSWPDVVVEEINQEEEPEPRARLCAYFSTLLNFPFFEVADVYDLKNDPLVRLTNSFNQLEPGETALFRVLVQLAYQEDYQGIRSVFRDYPLVKNLLRTDTEIKRYDNKVDSNLYRVVMGMEFDTPDRSRHKLLYTLADQITGFTHPNRVSISVAGFDQKEVEAPVNEIEADTLSSLWEQMGEDHTQLFQNLLMLSHEEVASLWHFPTTEFEASKLDAMGKLQVEMPKALRNITEGLLVGHNRFGAKEHQVKIPLDDRLTHTLIIGKNGTGKSSLMMRMISEDIQAGRGVCVIDPHGSLVKDVMQRCIPKERVDDVVLLDLSNEIDGKKYPPPLNLVSIAPRNLVDIISRVDGRFSGSQMADDLDLAMMLLEVADTPTLFDIRRIFQSENFRYQLLEKVEDIDAYMQWEEFESQSERDQRSRVRPLLRRLGKLYKRNEIAAITCNPHKFEMRQWMSQGKIILVSLQGTGNKLSFEDRRIIGTAMLSQIEDAAFAGAITNPQEKPFFVYIDETQNYETATLPRMLAEVRKFGIGLVMANQYLYQLSEATQKAVDGNVGTIMSFEIGQNDARIMQGFTKPQAKAEELMRLGKFRAVVVMRYQGDRMPAYTLETLPPPEKTVIQPADVWERHVRRTSVENMELMSYSEVVAILKKTYVDGKTRGSKEDPDDDIPNDEDDWYG